MPKDTPALTARDLIQDLRRSRSRIARTARVSVPTSIPYVQDIQEGAWDRLALAARVALRKHQREMQALESRRLEYNRHIQALHGVVAAYREKFLPVVSTPEWRTVRERAVKAMTGRGRPKASAEALFRKLESLKSGDIKANLAGHLQFSVDRLDSNADAVLTAAMGAILALGVARLNQGGNSTVAPAAVRNFCAAAERGLGSRQKAVWRRFRNATHAGLGSAARELADFAAGVLLDGGLKHAAALAQRRRSAASVSPDDARLALRLGELIRAALLALALGKKSVWLSHHPAGSAALETWGRAARKLRFSPAKAARIREIPIGRILAAPGRYEGKLLTVEGTVGKIDIVHRRLKVISTARIAGHDGRSLALALPYIKLDSGGMVEGAYASVTGIWLGKNKEINGPGLMVDRIARKELAAQNWLAWVTHELRTHYVPVPHGLNVRWSWQPGTDGPGNQVRYSTWYVH